MGNSLFVIGNGFDISHGIKSKYTDFKNYLLEKEKLKIIYEFLNEFFDENELWCDFEEKLSKINENKIVQVNNMFGIDVISSNYANMISDAFNSWVLNMREPKSILRKYIFKDNDCFFTFNYTLTLEEIYGIKDDNICHIHGVVGSYYFGHSIVYGHKPISLENSRCTGYVDFIKATEKNISKCIKENNRFFEKIKYEDISKIVILGFSYSDVDFEYFRLLSNIFPSANWIFTYYSNADFENAKKYIDKLKLSNIEVIHIEEYELKAQKR